MTWRPGDPTVAIPVAACTRCGNAHHVHKVRTEGGLCTMECRACKPRDFHRWRCSRATPHIAPSQKRPAKHTGNDSR